MKHKNGVRAQEISGEEYGITVHAKFVKLCIFTNSHGPALSIPGNNNLWNLGLFVYNLGI